MKLRRLITRRRAKWVGTTFAALLIIVFIVSGKYWGGVGWYTDDLQPSGSRIDLGDGQLLLTDSYFPPGLFDRGRSIHWHFRVRPRYRIDWGWEWHSKRNGTKYHRILYIPLWFPLLLIAAPTAWLWRTDRRIQPWQCPKCRYDLRGLEGGVCPECGREDVH